MRRLLGWISAAGDRLNPIAVKEFRQAVRSRLVVAVLMLFLLVDLLIMGGYLLGSPEAATSMDGGRSVFTFLVTVLFITCLGFVPLYAGVRLSLERNDANLDLLYVTTLPPGAIVRGKYLTAVALTLLIFSACMPFVVFTYLLRGIDLPTIFYVLAVGFLICAVANAMGVFAGCIPGSWFLRGLVGLGMLVILIYALAATLMGISYALMFGAFRTTGGWEFWAGLGSLVLMVLLGIGLLQVMSVALVSPKASNRMLVPRIYVLGSWAVAGVVMAVWSWCLGDPEYVWTWMIGFGVLFAILAMLALGERDAWNRRVRRSIPQNPLLRLLAFLFYTGSAGGIAWCTLMFAATLYVGYVGSELVSGTGVGPWGRSRFEETLTNLTMFFGYVLCYCLTTAFLRTILLKNIPTAYLPVVALMLVAALSLGPYLMAFFVVNPGYLRNDTTAYLVASPLMLTATNVYVEPLVGRFLAGWTLLGVVGSIPWFAGQWRRFLPYRAAAGG